MLSIDFDNLSKGAVMTRLASHLHRYTGRLDDERGDVPGWVLITLMTAGLVILIWGLAGPALSGIFTSAINKVTGL